MIVNNRQDKNPAAQSVWRRLPRALAALLAGCLLGLSAVAADLTVAAGAGYRKPVLRLIEMYREGGGETVVAAFGNMQQIVAQAQASGDIALLIGDEKFLRKVDFLTDFQTLGNGKMALAWPKGRAAIAPETGLTQPAIGRIALPDPEKAVYGLAADEWLKHKGLFAAVRAKLIHTATVPQVASYLVAGEVDAGFINVTDAIGLGESIGGYVVIEDGYSPIRIVAATVKGREDDPRLRSFLAFLRSARAAELLRSFGM